MLLIPAIDLKDGHCVRLEQGDMSVSTSFGDDPAAMARRWVEAGARRLHLVDLNGAFAGKPVNAAAVEAILAAVSIPVQLGGGIRDAAMVETWLARGIRRVILGTAAVRDPGFVREACRRFPGRVAVGIDARGGKVAVEGWAQTSDLTALELAQRFEDAGVAAIIYTDIARDGTQNGPNLWSTEAVAKAAGIDVFASGGVGSLDDIRQLATVPELAGVIVGRALYSGAVDLGAALAAVVR